MVNATMPMNLTDSSGLNALLAPTSPVTIKVVAAFFGPIVTRAISGLPKAPGINPASRSHLGEPLVDEPLGQPKTMGFSASKVLQLLMQVGMFACAINALVHDVTQSVQRFQIADSAFIGVLAVCVVIMSSPNFASYFSTMLIYCLHSSKSDGEDGKSFIFGESPGWVPCKQRLALLWCFFGVPEMLSKDVLMTMDPLPRAQLLMLQMLYLPPLRVICLAIGFPTIVFYFWFTFPLAGCLLMGTMVVSQVMMWEIKSTLVKRGFDGQAMNAIGNTLRWNLVLPVVFAPVMSVGTALGVRFLAGQGYLAAFENSFLHPTVSSFITSHLDGISAQMNAAYQFAR